MSPAKSREKVTGREFDDLYSADIPHFGRRPSPWLKDVVDAIVRPHRKRCLDLGCGHGRNAFYLAGRGFEVTAVDSSPLATGFLGKKAFDSGLPIRVVCDAIQNIEIEPAGADLIVAVTVLGSIPLPHIKRLADSLVRGLGPGGMLAIEDFSPQDPGASGASGASEFAHLVSNYFPAEDMKRLFPGLKKITCTEQRVIDATHGNPHRHGLVRYMGKNVDA